MSILDELTPAWLKERFLLGVDLTLDDGTPYPDSIYQQAIQAGIAYLEHEIGITIDPFDVAGEQHDAYELNRSGFWPFRLDHRPVLKVNFMEVRFGGFAPAELPTSWAQLVSPIHGQIHLIPSEESIHSSYKFTHGIPLITGDVLQPQRYVPGYFHFDYTAGFETRTVDVVVKNGETVGTTTFATSPIKLRYEATVTTNPLAGQGITAKVSTRGHEKLSITLSQAAPQDTTLTATISTLPADIKQAIGYKAALLPLDVAGDLIAGAGIANLHVGVDGLSQSLGTTASATNSGYGARVLQFERELKALLPALRAKYKLINMGAL